MADDDNTTSFPHPDANDENTTLNATGLNLGGLGAGSRGQGQSQQVSPLEQEVLDEYEKLSGNMRELSQTLTRIAQGPLTIEIAEGLRLLERKVASVYTLMKASVYSIVLQQGAIEAEEGAGSEALLTI